MLPPPRSSPDPFRWCPRATLLSGKPDAAVHTSWRIVSDLPATGVLELPARSGETIHRLVHPEKRPEPSTSRISERFRAGQKRRPRELLSLPKSLGHLALVEARLFPRAGILLHPNCEKSLRWSALAFAQCGRPDLQIPSQAAEPKHGPPSSCRRP